MKATAYYAAALALCSAACSDVGGDSAQATSQSPPALRPVDDARLLAAADEPESWLTHGGTYLEQRFSALDQINRDNVERLRPAWFFELDTDRNQEGTPLVADGVLYTISAWSKVYALDAKTGALLWRFDPEVSGADGAKACCDVSSRGLALYEDKVIFAALDGRLIALDRASGAPVWSTLTVDPSKMYTITGAPRVVRNKVIIGNSGAEFGVRGYVSAYDTDTGELVWRFYTVPGDPAAGPDGAASDQALADIAAPTWFGRWYEYGGGGTVWDAIVYDPELDQLYVGTGNGSPWNRIHRSDGQGDNLFLASVLALDPDTGEYLWHYQESPGDAWDFTATQPMILTDLTIAGEARKVLLHAPKNGFFYVLDRRDGRVVSANPFVPTTWATHVDLATGRPAIPPEAYYEEAPFFGTPTGAGAHNWSPMAWSPLTGLVYFRASRSAQVYRHEPNFVYVEGLNNIGIHRGPPHPDDAAIIAANPRIEGSALLAWDPVAGGPRWQADGFGSGVLATAGQLVFQGRGAVTGELIAFDAETGERLWSHATPNSMSPGPISYAVDGEQYIAIMSGRGFAGGDESMARARQPGRLLAFKLDGTAVLPPEPGPPPPFNPPDESWADDVVAEGSRLYHQMCSRCHGNETRSINVIPDLRRSAALTSPALWRAIVLDGTLEANGMVGWSQYIDAEGAERIRAYVGSRAQAL